MKLSRSSALICAPALLSLAVQAQVRFEHVRTVDLSSIVVPGNPSFIGTSAANCAWNGSELLIAGWNAGMATTVGIVRVSDVLGTPLIGAPFGVETVISGMGYTGLDLHGNLLAAPLDTGATAPNGLSLWDTSGNLLWSFSARCTSGAAFDPDFQGSWGADSGVGWVSFAGGRRALNDLATGAETWSLATGMIINSSSGTTWRDLDFDEETGDAYLRKSNAVTRAVRTGGNSCVASVIVTPISSTQPRTNIEVLNADGGKYLIFNDRFTNATGQSFFTVTKVTDTNGAAVPADWGSFAPPTSNAAYDYGWDSASDTLVVLDITNTQAYVFQLLRDAQDGSFCFGDGIDTGHATPCPCGNLGGPGRGCANSINPLGAELFASGTAAADEVRLHGSGMPASSTCVYLQGTALSDAVFGDGVRCTGGQLVRLSTKLNLSGTSSFPQAGVDTLTLSQRGGVTVGSGVLRYYQTYYRDPSPGFCPSATFNVTNGWKQVW
ncbi:MAG: hypothetical protein IPJ19_16440 [Planctomycetes bacterium]|nr:hypothetical protein [Planctomycetota bacterium]